MTDIVFIEGLTVFTTIGIYDWEKNIKQKLIIDIEMAWDNRQAGKTDDVKFCLNYASVSEFVQHHLLSHQFGLIEKVAEDIASLIIEQFSVSRIKVKVSKPSAIAFANNVGVMIERSR